MDFGERLAEMRERLMVPLPSRVPVARLFISVYTDSMCGFLVLFTGKSTSPPSFLGLHDPAFQMISDEFRTLKDVYHSVEQVEQAQRLAQDVMMHYQRLVYSDLECWLATIDAALFLSSMTSILLLLSMSLSIWTEHLTVSYLVFSAFLIIHGIAITIRTSQWFRP